HHRSSLPCGVRRVSRPLPTATPFPYTTLFRSPHCIPILYRFKTGAQRTFNPSPPQLQDLTIRAGQNEAIASLAEWLEEARESGQDRKSTRLNSSHVKISYAVFCLKKKNTIYAR